jgi:hypothetical protein
MLRERTNLPGLGMQKAPSRFSNAKAVSKSDLTLRLGNPTVRWANCSEPVGQFAGSLTSSQAEGDPSGEGRIFRIAA